ncbi:ParB/RepB/Spo0J family partition protein [Acidimangrovimonas sediminis]|uniref:ParB/RepB/Spo0J family partition protein n=1 Tax=Acidimangrovimonas sediminis TaxID=2056283 RepID=UPI000C8004DA|nr:ParB N-terminal domain-containing protein [Acidimangrovimonas sediminis]
MNAEANRPETYLGQDSIDVSIDAIEANEGRARALDMNWVRALADMIREQGLLQPIRVRDLGDGRWSLTAGHHRLIAAKVAGFAKIRCIVSTASNADEARLEEVMENLGRNELNALDRCCHLFELKRVWEKLYPETKAGVAGGKARQGSANEMFSFATATAEKIGLSKRAIQISVKIWTDLTPEARRRLVGTETANKQTELKALSEQKPDLQGKILDLILGDGPVGNVAQALDFLANGVAQNALEKRYLKVSQSLGALDDVTFDNVLAAHEDRVIASLKRRGRI